MGIAKMKLIDITANLEQLDVVLARFIDVKDFHPVLASEIVERVHGLTSFVDENPCSTLLQEIEDIETKYDLNFPVIEQEEQVYNFNEMYDYLVETKEQLGKEIDRIKKLEDHIREYNDALIQVKNIDSLDIPLEDLFACEFVSIRFGRLPNDSVEKLKFFQSKPFVFKSFNHDQNNSWCMYFTTDEYKREVDNIFSSLFFERIYIPDFVHGKPKEAIHALETEIAQAEKMVDQYRSDMTDITQECSNKISCIKGELLFLNRIFEAKKYVVGLGDKFQISGFVETDKVDSVIHIFDGISDIEVQSNEAESDRRITPPTKLKNSWFTKPFGMFVEMYGLPGYRDIDPTPFVAITYSLLFGIMFGDVGQGLVLMFIGWFFWHYKKMRLGAVGLRIGISSTIFGFLYGSVFGYEHLLDHFFHDTLGLSFLPIHVMEPEFTMTLLIAAIGIGALLIVISMILNIITLVRKRRFVDLVCSHNGIAGFILFTFTLVAIGLQMGFEVKLLNIFTIILFIGIPLLLIFFKEPIERGVNGHKIFPTGFGGFFVEGFFELFEIVLSYITNTMSFLRVGGFILSHAGMMLVVHTLMEGMATSGSILTLVLGNLFVMGLEGLIVGIQVLRLEFYEMFSRYYEGNGIAFNALNNQ